MEKSLEIEPKIDIQTTNETQLIVYKNFSINEMFYKHFFVTSNLFSKDNTLDFTAEDISNKIKQFNKLVSQNSVHKLNISNQLDCDLVLYSLQLIHYNPNHNINPIEYSIHDFLQRYISDFKQKGSSLHFTYKKSEILSRLNILCTVKNTNRNDCYDSCLNFHNINPNTYKNKKFNNNSYYDDSIRYNIDLNEKIDNSNIINTLLKPLIQVMHYIQLSADAWHLNNLNNILFKNGYNPGYKQEISFKYENVFGYKPSKNKIDYCNLVFNHLNKNGAVKDIVDKILAEFDLSFEQRLQEAYVKVKKQEERDKSVYDVSLIKKNNLKAIQEKISLDLPNNLLNLETKLNLKKSSTNEIYKETKEPKLIIDKPKKLTSDKFIQEVELDSVINSTRNLKPSSNSVYVIQVENINLFKIGYTSNFEKRLKGLRWSIPFELNVVYHFEFIDGLGAEFEQWLHIKLKSKIHKTTNEWFNLDEQDLIEIKGYYESDTWKEQSTL